MQLGSKELLCPDHTVYKVRSHSEVRGPLAKRTFQRFVSTTRICVRREVARYIVVGEVAPCFNIRGHCIREFGDDDSNKCG